VEHLPFAFAIHVHSLSGFEACYVGPRTLPGSLAATFLLEPPTPVSRATIELFLYLGAYRVLKFESLGLARSGAFNSRSS
jgi:hypothetical protein